MYLQSFESTLLRNTTPVRTLLVGKKCRLFICFILSPLFFRNRNLFLVIFTFYVRREMQGLVARVGGLLIHMGNFTSHIRIISFELCSDNLLYFLRIAPFFLFPLSFVLISAIILLCGSTSYCIFFWYTIIMHHLTFSIVPLY